MGARLDWMGEDRPTTGMVELELESHLTLHLAIAVQVGDDPRPTIHHDDAGPPGGALPEIALARDAGRRCRDEPSGIGDRLPAEPARQARSAHVPGRILDGPAFLADLQGKGAFGGPDREAQSGPAACAGQGDRLACTRKRVLARRRAERLGHGPARASTAAPEQRPRS